MLDVKYCYSSAVDAYKQDWGVGNKRDWCNSTWTFMDRTIKKANATKDAHRGYEMYLVFP